ncbi:MULTISPECIES: hypothetical protein [unclassified Pseudomonas]|uniref:hypothetical protein n=1 Tax=unclassified Pseudomonas TaxID=196821 RepID=UPI002AC957C6|nr:MULTISPECIES: hypothetical protein [unclassified Pseudomonas]MEB0040890.1 hypothetical protein [Pseudomonas sp. MH10]MEB0079564.1 hypothetical protein [Pseudomonas sp. MH10out]MEB0090183.1 hypothetical protein [Pseudomonas sp. CCI4.2]MEB0102661.1 hypothetical protein [Pseudomonas sp. CCI3.2]MEB0119453.1 hypothetical protein [Pseudomonas sp. CCI1.2]
MLRDSAASKTRRHLLQTLLLKQKRTPGEGRAPREQAAMAITLYWAASIAEKLMPF